MADRRKKRKASGSPSRTQKRRRASGSTSSTPSSLSVQQGSRRPAFSGDSGSARTLPTSSDWRFRLKVISSPTVDDEVFEEAVQGLVQICFPEEVLDELGIAVVAKHMLEEGAPQRNIERMRDVFQSAMIHRVAWMLAQYLDTSEKLELGMSALVTASHRLHGHPMGSEDAPDSPAEAADREDATTEDDQLNIAHDSTLSNTSTSEPSDSSHSEPEPEPRRQKSKKDKRSKPQSGKKKRAPSVDATQDSSESEAEVQDVATGIELPLSKKEEPRKERTVSSTWRWDVDYETISKTDIRDAFKRTSDLYAYHALPVARANVGPLAKRKVVRHEIQSNLEEMPETEFGQWVDSFEKLHDGDIAMLKRAKLPQSDSTGRDIARATPAPSSMRGRNGNRFEVYNEGATTKKKKNSLNTRTMETPAECLSPVGEHSPTIKQERDTDAVGLEEAPTGEAQHEQDSVSAPTSAFRKLSTEEPTPVTPTDPRHVLPETPIVDLLYRRGTLDTANWTTMVQTILDNLNVRVSKIQLM